MTWSRSADRALSSVRSGAGSLARWAVERGLPPQVTGFRALPRRRALDHDEVEVVHPAGIADGPGPVNADDLGPLPDDAGWWGFSMRQVPSRRLAPTLITTLHDARVVGYRDAARSGDYVPAIVDGRGRALEARELRLRPGHARALRRRHGVVHLERATWIVERVYHNHSHWLNAHLPKLVMLRERGELDDVILPDDLSPAQLDSLRRLGLGVPGLRFVDVDRPLRVDELRVVSTDRFRPELLCPTRDALVSAARRPGAGQLVFVSRRRAGRRRLVGEDGVLEALRPHGVDDVVMEDLDFDAQCELMAGASVVIGPHGAGLTNMIACPPGVLVVEIADPAFPNPNFHAMASALGHRYAYVPARSVGDGDPLARDLVVEPAAVARVVADHLART